MTNPIPIPQAGALLPPITAAYLLGVHEQTLRNWRHRKIGPVWYTLANKRVIYRLSDLEEYLERGRQLAKRRPYRTGGRPRKYQKPEI
jgi:hypothetical protein